MTAASTAHANFTIERIYHASPARVFAAFATQEAKARWFVGPAGTWTLIERSLDFRPGGRETLKGAFGAGKITFFDCIFFDIVEDRRIIYGYDMYHSGAKLSVSLVTIELFPEGKGTRLVFTQHAVFLDGYEDGGSRERGEGMGLDRLGSMLAEGV